MKKKKIVKLVFFIAVCQAAGVFGSLFTVPAIPAWYDGLRTPPLTPPAWVFGPVWTLLFILMAVSAYLISEAPSGETRRRPALVWFFVQLALNSLWSVLFFGLRSPAAAFLEIGILWYAIFRTASIFFRISKPAGWLMVPYLAWVSFAAYLNYGFAVMNF